ncbi:peptidoglycan DD-metalloendopeptidase family protein [Desulfurivibrio alkaliphilus]|uniref:Peptidase M23 n=1 Tax=Desulfurivibrio alkaliphilus (strain DSM 19089 / UNIQEM U267 / AHT2) TaxID=589865 RepID=D6Z551_DESAT|nr:peptidoglycan DD-metalloendopeptidase family protein [Desulfurivibrio alkaliphilus]ADH86676.1 Peptidase M23 [Desulfurivibrio alkaliphilus AHT 2]
MDLTTIFSSYPAKPGISRPHTATDPVGKTDFAEMMAAGLRQPPAAGTPFRPDQAGQGLPRPDATTPVWPDTPEPRPYTVRPGDTLSGIVAGKLRQNSVAHSRGELYRLVNLVASDNNLTNPDRIFPGQKLDVASIPQFAASNRLPAIATPSAVQQQGTSSELQPPAMGRISSSFGIRLHPVTGQEQHHDGVDIVLPHGTPIKPVAAGRVIAAGENGNYGLTVDIDHGDGLTSRYAHLSRVLVEPGQQIQAGQTIARSGATGLANGPHLHLEIHQDRQPVNPLALLSRDDIERGPLLADGTRPGDPDPETGEYTVQPGDTLSTIAARELHRRGVDFSPQELYRQVQHLAATNNLSNPDQIVSGQRINLSSLLSDRFHV